VTVSYINDIQYVSEIYDVEADWLSQLENSNSSVTYVLRICVIV